MILNARTRKHLCQILRPIELKTGLIQTGDQLKFIFFSVLYNSEWKFITWINTKVYSCMVHRQIKNAGSIKKN